LAKQVTDRFHVQKLASEAVQEIRIKYRWEAIDADNEAITDAQIIVGGLTFAALRPSCIGGIHQKPPIFPLKAFVVGMAVKISNFFKERYKINYAFITSMIIKQTTKLLNQFYFYSSILLSVCN
jgi:hypothetical protein